MFKIKQYPFATSVVAILFLLTALMTIWLLTGQTSHAQTEQLWTCDDITQISRQECDALQSIFDAGFGGNGGEGDIWFSNRTPCLWGRNTLVIDSVGCDNVNGVLRVTHLTAGKNVLFLNYPADRVATFPPAIGQLQWLNTLRIENNEFVRQLPSEIGNLTQLERLILQNNSVLTDIPAEIGNLSNLMTLSMENNPQLQEIPSEIGNLDKLSVLTLWRNPDLAVVPSTIGNLRNLEHLALNDLGIVTVPEQIGNLSQLQLLLIQNNDHLQAIPAEIGQLRDLEKLTIALNPMLSSVPSELARENFSPSTQYYIDVPVEESGSSSSDGDDGQTAPTNPNACPASGVWPAGCDPNLPPRTNNPPPPINRVPCPTSGVWPAGCVPNGGGGTTPPPPSNGGDCVIPASGPWPPCATNGDPAPPDTPADCIIPPSGPWPPCAKGN